MKVVAICSRGGHMAELKRAIPRTNELDIIWVTASAGHSSIEKKRGTFYIRDPHKSKVMFFVNFLQSILLFLMTRPSVVISSGAGLCIFYCLICKLFGSRLIFLETGARITTPSKTGKLLYKYSDLFIVQSEQLLEHYPNAKLGVLG